MRGFLFFTLFPPPPPTRGYTGKVDMGSDDGFSFPPSSFSREFLSSFLHRRMPSGPCLLSSPPEVFFSSLLSLPRLAGPVLQISDKTSSDMEQSGPGAGAGTSSGFFFPSPSAAPLPPADVGQRVHGDGTDKGVGDGVGFSLPPVTLPPSPFPPLPGSRRGHGGSS